jgi:hypothetical protein
VCIIEQTKSELPQPAISDRCRIRGITYLYSPDYGPAVTSLSLRSDTPHLAAGASRERIHIPVVRETAIRTEAWVAGPTDGKTNLIGTASLCTVQKSPLDLDIPGSLDAWWLENGKAVTLYLLRKEIQAPDYPSCGTAPGREQSWC